MRNKPSFLRHLHRMQRALLLLPQQAAPATRSLKRRKKSPKASRHSRYVIHQAFVDRMGSISDPLAIAKNLRIYTVHKKHFIIVLPIPTCFYNLNIKTLLETLCKYIWSKNKQNFNPQNIYKIMDILYCSVCIHAGVYKTLVGWCKCGCEYLGEGYGT